MLRGGYGFTRLLDRIDFAALARARKRWMGHSDFTAFQLAALARAGMVTFAGPMAAYDFGARGAVGVHARRSASACSSNDDMGRRMRARRAVAHGAKRHAVGRQPRDGRASRRARRTSRTSTAASCSSRTSASIRTASSGCSTSCCTRACSRASARCCSAHSPNTSSMRTTPATTSAAAIAQLRARARRADLHGPAVRPRARQVDAAGRRSLRAGGARRRSRAAAACRDYRVNGERMFTVLHLPLGGRGAAVAPRTPRRVRHRAARARDARMGRRRCAVAACARRRCVRQCDRLRAPASATDTSAASPCSRLARTRRGQRADVASHRRSRVRRGDARVILNAQVAAMPFYARHGFVASGDVFDEAGIAHRVMTRALRLTRAALARQPAPAAFASMRRPEGDLAGGESPSRRSCARRSAPRRRVPMRRASSTACRSFR